MTAIHWRWETGRLRGPARAAVCAFVNSITRDRIYDNDVLRVNRQTGYRSRASPSAVPTLPGVSALHHEALGHRIERRGARWINDQRSHAGYAGQGHPCVSAIRAAEQAR